MKKINNRKKRHKRVRRKILGTSKRPRLNVYKSNSNFYAQFIDDMENKVIFGISTLNREFKKKHKYGGNKEAAKALGKMFAEEAKKKNIKKCFFDRSGYLYHGRVKFFAEGAKEEGLSFRLKKE